MRKLTFAAFVAVTSMAFGVSLNDGLVFDLDLSAGDANGNGRVDKEEVSDRITAHAATPNTVSAIQYNESLLAEGFEPITINPADVTDPYHGLWSVTNSRPCLYFPQSMPDSTKCAAHYVKFKTCPINSDCTVRLRFKWDGNTYTGSHNIFIAMNGYQWTAPGYGWGVGLLSYGSTSGMTAAKLLNMVGQKSHTGLSVTAGIWYDVVYTIEAIDDSSCKVAMYLCAESSASGSYRPAITHTSATLATKLSPIYSSNGFWLGGENKGTAAWVATTANTAKNVFRGTIADVQVWNRILSADEVCMLFSGARGEIWSIGAANGKADEFGDATDTPATFNVETDAWGDFPRSLDASRTEVTLSAPWQEANTNMPQVLTITPLLSGAAALSCPVEILVNGTSAGTMDLASEHEFRICKKLIQRNTVGRLEITIRRTTTDGTLEFDALSLGGSFQVGEKNNTNSEFATSRQAQQTYVVGDTSYKHFVDALWYNNSNNSDGVNRSSYSNECVLAYIPVTAAAAPMRFRVRINCRGTPLTHTIGFYVNGVKKATWAGCGEEGLEDFSYEFAPGEMPTGLVSLMISDESVMSTIESANRWAYIDYVALEATGFPKGTIVQFR